MQLNDDEIKAILSQNIKSARLSSNLTQDAFSELSNISLDFLKAIETGRSGISISTLISICHALNITPNDLLKDFFKDSYNKCDNISKKLKFLNNYQIDVINLLVQHFTDNEMK